QLIGNKLKFLNQSSESNRVGEEIVKATLKLCILEISKGMIDNVSIHFENLKDDNKIDQVLKSVNDDFGQLNQLKNIVNFIKKLPRCSQHAQAFSFLFEMIKSSNHFDNRIILSVFNSMKCFSDCIGNRTIQQLNTDLQEAILIFLNDYLPEIVKHTYSNNFEKTLKFIINLPWLLHWYEGYNALFYSMKQNGHFDSTHLVKLAYRVKDEINKPNEASVIEQLREVFKNLKDQFPKGVLDLLWDPWIVIESRLHPGHTLYGGGTGNVYVCSDNYYEGENSRVLHATDEDIAKIFEENPIGVRDFWEVIPVQNGSYYFFKNKYNQRILHAKNTFGYGCWYVEAYKFYAYTNQEWIIR
ncbi:unnamed protein product, partial [Brachionus calyciflorus]